MAAEPIPDEARRTYLGSHDTAGIAGYSPYLTPMQIYMNKLGMADGQRSTPLMEWGSRLQPAILEKFAEEMRVDLECERFIRHPSLHWFGGTPDATIKGAKAGVDAKNVQYFDEDWGEEYTDEIPRHLLFQCHHFLALMDYDVWYVAALGNRSVFRIYRVKKDPEIADMIIAMDGEFWNDHVAAEVPPPIDGSSSWRKYVERRFPMEMSQVRPATGDELSWLEELRAAEAAKKECEARVDFLKNNLAASIGDAAGLVSDVAKVSYKQVKGRAGFDHKSLKEAMPEIYDQYATTGAPYRALRVTYAKEQEG